MANVLGLDTCKHYKERQTNLQNRVKTLLDEKFHCLLNDIFHVQFPVSREMSRMSKIRKQKQLEALFMKILAQTVREERIIFIIDEAQFVDGTSWAFIEKLIRSMPIFIVMSLAPFSEVPCAAANAIMKNRNTTYITLGTMQPQEIRDKVCVDLSVSSIPRELDSYLVEGSCGIPYYCEELLKNLDHHRVLLFQQAETEQKTNVTWNNMFKHSVRPTDDMQLFTSISEGQKEVCYLVSGVRLNNLSPPASLKVDEEEAIFSKSELPRKYKFPENLSITEIREKILHFFDNVILKMKSSPNDIIPLESCQCKELLQIVILPLAQHFVALEENNKALYYFLELASAYLILGDNYNAYMYLGEGERLLKSLTNEDSWSQTFEYATFYSLKAEVCFNMGQMVLAKKMLRKALKLLNRMFPCNLLTLTFQMHVEKNRLSHFMNQHTQEGSVPGKKLAQLYLQASCFSLLWRIYSLNFFFHYKYYGHLAAMMEMNTSLETQNDFQIIKAYLDFSLYHHLAGYQGVWFKYEILVMEQLLNLPLKGEAIEIMAYTADTLGHIKFLMGHLDLAIELGSRAHRMWSLLRNPNKYQMVLCRLSKPLFLKSRYKHLVQVLGWLWDLSVTEEDIFSKAFFYFVCLDIMLYSGFIYRTFEECLEFIHHNEDNRILKFQSGLLLGLYSCIAVWYARLQEWDNFNKFSDRAKHLVTRRTPTVLYYEGISRYMEGQVLHLQKQIEEQAENAQDSGVEILKALETLVAQNTTGPVFYPRLYHLMAYVCILMGDGHSCDFFLNTALELSETHGNLLEKCWLSMSKEWWYSASELTGDQWLQTVLSLPSWDKIVSGNVTLQDVQKNKYLMRVNILDNPF